MTTSNPKRFAVNDFVKVRPGVKPPSDLRGQVVSVLLKVRLEDGKEALYLPGELELISPAEPVVTVTLNRSEGAIRDSDIDSATDELLECLELETDLRSDTKMARDTLAAMIAISESAGVVAEPVRDEGQMGVCGHFEPHTKEYCVQSHLSSYTWKPEPLPLPSEPPFCTAKSASGNPCLRTFMHAGDHYWEPPAQPEYPEGSIGEWITKGAAQPESKQRVLEFKECYECYAKPGAPILCPQCIWTRERWRKAQEAACR